MKKRLFYAAAVGWTLSLIVNLITMAGIDLADKMPFVPFLHVGIFAVFIPTIFMLSKNEELQALKKEKPRSGPFAMFKIVFKHTPKWLTYLVIGSFVYGLFNFIFSIGQAGSTSIIDGAYVIHNHGTIIKTITEQEYHLSKATELQAFSGFWMVFYSFAAGAVCPFNKPNENS